MVNDLEKTREAIQQLIVYVCGLSSFDRKKEVVDTLYTLEWSLRPIEEKKACVDPAEDLEEIHDGHEEPWS